MILFLHTLLFQQHKSSGQKFTAEFCNWKIGKVQRFGGLLPRENTIWKRDSSSQIWDAAHCVTMENRTVSVFPYARIEEPIICLNTIINNGQKVFRVAQVFDCPLFALAATINLGRNYDMVPRDSPFTKKYWFLHGWCRQLFVASDLKDYPSDRDGNYPKIAVVRNWRIV